MKFSTFVLPSLLMAMSVFALDDDDDAKSPGAARLLRGQEEEEQPTEEEEDPEMIALLREWAEYVSPDEEDMEEEDTDEEDPNEDTEDEGQRRLQDAPRTKVTWGTGSGQTAVGYWNGGPFVYNRSPLLQEFSFDFVGGSRSMDKIGVYTYHDAVRTFFKDRNAGEPMKFVVRGVEPPRGSILKSKCGYSDDLSDSDSIPHNGGITYGESYSSYYEPILHGWSVDYVEGRGDHPVKQLGVGVFQEPCEFNCGRRRPQIWVTYGDKYPDTRFFYCVQYALVPKNKVTFTGYLSGRDFDGSDSVYARGPSWGADQLQPVIRSFRFDFDNTDHHLDKLRVRVRKYSGNRIAADVTLDDNFDPDGSYSWQVTYSMVAA